MVLNEEKLDYLEKEGILVLYTKEEIQQNPKELADALRYMRKTIPAQKKVVKKELEKLKHYTDKGLYPYLAENARKPGCAKRKMESLMEAIQKAERERSIIDGMEEGGELTKIENNEELTEEEQEIIFEKLKALGYIG